jgi:ornithine decarboxylase
VSAAVTPGVARALSRLTDGPTLMFDREVIAARLAAVRAAAHAVGVQALFAVKACPLPEVLSLVAEQFDGLDVAGPEEQAMARIAPTTIISVTWPGDTDPSRLMALAARHRVIAVCETASQLAAAASVPEVELAVRLSVSALVDEEAPGGLRLGDRHASRFGVAPDELRVLREFGGDRLRALHLHGGPLATSPARLAKLATAALAAAESAGIALARLDLGGSLHGFALDAPTAGQATLADALAAVRAVVPSSIELAIEPGRVIVDGAGFAVGRVLASRAIGGRETRTLSLSRLCHLRWSSPRLVSPPPRAGEGVPLTLLGATCCEDDVIADALVPADAVPAVRDRVVLSAVSGYAAAWNRSFAGVPAARIVVA